MPETQRSGRPATISDLVDAFLQSPGFSRLAPRSQSGYARILESIRSELGSVPATDVCRRDVAAFRDAWPHTPSAANRRLLVLRVVLHHAVDMGWRRDDPTAGVRPLPSPMREPACWSEADIRRFEERHPPGSVARRAFSLILYAAMRAPEAVAAGPGDVDGDSILARRGCGGTGSWLPLHPALKAELDRAPADGSTFLASSRGVPFSASEFVCRFRRWCAEAGLPHCRARGLREAGIRRLAEAGCTPHKIMAITGHRSLKEVERYAGKANLPGPGQPSPECGRR